jgi:hypothetical protein
MVTRDVGKAVREEGVFETIAHVIEIFASDFVLAQCVENRQYFIRPRRFESASP